MLLGNGSDPQALGAAGNMTGASNPMLQGNYQKQADANKIDWMSNLMPNASGHHTLMSGPGGGHNGNDP